MINAALVFLLNKTGLHYTSVISFNTPNIEHSVFFNALVVSYLCIVVTCYVIYLTCCNYFKDKLFGFWVGLLYLLGGGTYAFCMTPIMDASSGLFMALAFKTFIEKSKWLYLILFLSIFQREYISIVIGTIAFVGYLFEKKDLKQTIFVIVAALSCFVAYIVLRKTFFYTPETVEREQLQVSQFASRLFDKNINFAEYFRQVLFLQNILFIYVLVLLYKYTKKQTINKKQLVTIGILLVQIFIISFIAIVVNNASRVVYMLTPIILFYMAIEIY
ncbi:MAG TPA: hypothetical protein VNX01_01405, partial [Bacteroidia bacterium]|nr:hypothetical protein [Bacteroidia bacterium]